MVPTRTVFEQVGRWRLVGIPAVGRLPVVEFRLGDGSWAYLDCGYSCVKCGACLGCVRKLLCRADEWPEDAPGGHPDGWRLAEEWMECKAGGDHECFAEDPA